MGLALGYGLGLRNQLAFGGSGLPKPLLSVEGPAVGGYLVDTSGNGNNVQVVNNLLTNFDCERDFGYVAFNGTPLVNQRSSEQAFTGTYSRKVQVSGASGIKTPLFTTVTGETVTVEIQCKLTAQAGTLLKYYVRNGLDSSVVASGNMLVTLNSWRKTTFTYTETAGGSKAFIGVYVDTGSATFYLDDFKATVTSYGDGIILPDVAELKAADTKNIFYDTSGNALTVRHRMFWGDYGYNTWLYPNLGVKLYPSTLSKSNYLKVAKNIDYGKRLFDSIENTVTVKKDGTGNYLLPQSAVDAITTATLLNRFKVAIYDDFAPSTLAEYTKVSGSYNRFVELKDYVYLDGVGTQKKIECTLPATITDAQSTFYECMVAEAHTGARNICFSQKNGRYACHIDASVAAGKLQQFYNCEFHHLGSQEIFDYRIANSQSYAGVFSGQTGLGTGCYSGQNMILKDCTLSGIVPIGWHTNVNFSSIASIKMVNCTVTALPIKDQVTNPTSQVLHSIALSNLTSRLQNICDIIGGAINSFIKYNGEYYEPTATNLYILNDIILSLYPAVSVTNSLTEGGSLMITSSNVNGSVTITGGTAQAVIIPTPDTVGNAAIGRLEVGEWAKNANTKLGVRLGNCSVTNKTLTLTVDGTINKTITFNQNFTAQTNAQVLAFINAALGVDATASLYQRAKDYLPAILT